MNRANTKRDRHHFRGCLLGGALGDALGYAVEFESLKAIKQRYGPSGITILPEPALISDDTQMTMFTAEDCCGPISGAMSGGSVILPVWSTKPICAGSTPRGK